MLDGHFCDYVVLSRVSPTSIRFNCSKREHREDLLSQALFSLFSQTESYIPRGKKLQFDNLGAAQKDLWPLAMAQN